MHIQHKDDGQKGAFFIAENGLLLAEMTYVWSTPHLFIIDHTEVSPELRGQRIGNKLLDEAVAFARSKDVKILPLCPFAKAVFDRTPAFQDLLP